MADEDINSCKASRKALKGVLTKEIGTAERLIAEEETDLVKAQLEVVKEKFKNFEAGHDKYHALVQDENEIDASEAYFADVLKNYITSFKQFKSWVNERCPKLEDQKTPDQVPVSSKVEPPGAAKSSISNAEALSGGLWKMLNTPKVEIEPFDGDPLKFHSFFAIFDECVHNTDMDDTSKLTRLIQATAEDANTAILPCVLIGGSRGYNEARRILESRFGNSFLVSERIISSLRKGKPIRTARDLLQLADELSNAYEALVRMNCLSEIDSQNSIIEIVNRLQLYLKNRWKKLALESKRDKERYPDFKYLVDFVRREADEANDPVYGQFGSHSRSSTDLPKKQSTSLITSTNVHPQKTKSSYRSPCVVCRGEHRLFYCDDFKKMKVPERIDVVRKFKLCENCLLANHDVKNCRKQSTCSVPDCGRKHTKFIHMPENSSANSEQSVVANSVNLSDDIHLPVVPVIVNGSCETYALLDSGSTNSFCSQNLVDELGIKGAVVKYSLNTLSHANESKQSKVVSLNLNSQDGTESLSLSNVFVVDSIPVRCSSFDKDKYPHLNGLPIVQNVSKVNVLIGQDNSEALIPLEVKRGNKGSPFAVRTMFGWSLNGPASVASPVNKTVISYFIAANSVEEKIDRLWKI